MKQHRLKQASFVRQALLIAAPLMILSAVALYSLRQDRAAIERDARDRAQALASSLATQWRDSASGDLSGFLVDWYLDKFVPVATAWPEGSGIGQVQDAGEVRILAQRAHGNPLLKALPQLRGHLLDGQILAPVDFPGLPAPPDWIGRLTLEQSRTWQSTGRVFYDRREAAAGRQALAALRSAGLPEAALAGFELHLELLETRGSSQPDTIRRLTDLARRYPEAHTEAGSPVADVALIRALRTSAAGPFPDLLRQELYHRVIGHPSFLTPELIAGAGSGPADPQNLETARILKDLWLAQESARTLLRSLLKMPPNPNAKLTEIWLEAGDQLFLAQREMVFSKDEKRVPRPPGSDISVNLIPGRVLEQAFANASAKTRNQIPSYLAASVMVGSKRWPVTPGGLDQAHEDPEHSELATASAALNAWPTLPSDLWIRAKERNLAYLGPPEHLTIPFTISLELARPDLLYASYRRRIWFSVGLVLLASAAAATGLVSAWRAFQRQLQLAEMTTNFVSSVSHELRAPLASVRLMAESLDRGRIKDDEKRKSYFRLIVQECRRLSSLVENVLDFSRIRQGRKRYEFEPINLAALIRQTVKLMEPHAGEMQVSLLLSEPQSGSEEMQPCWDGQAVQQALVNLIDNAIKHSPPGKRVMVGFEAVKGPGQGGTSGIQLTVEDQGPGIPAEEQEQIFEPFYRRGTELRRETRGIGIGLSIVKHVAEAHGGHVLVKSVSGQGSLFTLVLPMRAAAAD
jgi:signal transduction histidine kinase